MPTTSQGLSHGATPVVGHRPPRASLGADRPGSSSWAEPLPWVSRVIHEYRMRRARDGQSIEELSGGVVTQGIWTCARGLSVTISQVRTFEMMPAHAAVHPSQHGGALMMPSAVGTAPTPPFPSASPAPAHPTAPPAIPPPPPPPALPSFPHNASTVRGGPPRLPRAHEAMPLRAAGARGLPCVSTPERG